MIMVTNNISYFINKQIERENLLIKLNKCLLEKGYKSILSIKRIIRYYPMELLNSVVDHYMES